jgi:hypothetical protein
LLDSGEPCLPGAAGQAGVDVVWPQGAAVDEAGVCLNQSGAGLDTFPGVVGGFNSPGGYQYEPAARTGIQQPQYLQGSLLERCT